MNNPIHPEGFPNLTGNPPKGPHTILVGMPTWWRVWASITNLIWLIAAGALAGTQNGFAADTNSQRLRSGDTNTVMLDAENRLIGSLVSIQFSTDSFGRPTPAHVVLTSSGRIASILADGSIGGIPIMYFRQKDCQGEALASTAPSDAGAPLLPGVMFSFGDSPALFWVPFDSRPISFSSLSFSALSSRGPQCMNQSTTVEGYVISTTTYLDGGLVYKQVRSPRISTSPVRSKSSSGSLGGASLPGQSEDLVESASLQEIDARQCARQCDMVMIGDGECDVSCLHSQCNFDGGDCSEEAIRAALDAQARQCSAGCDEPMVGDGFCDTACNTEACKFDLADCNSAD